MLIAAFRSNSLKFMIQITADGSYNTINSVCNVDKDLNRPDQRSNDNFRSKTRCETRKLVSYRLFSLLWFPDEIIRDHRTLSMRQSLKKTSRLFTAGGFTISPSIVEKKRTTTRPRASYCSRNPLFR